MTRLDRFERNVWRFIRWLFALTEERLPRCDCEAHCRPIRKQQEAKRRGTTTTGEMHD